MKSEALKKAQSKYRREKITSLKIDLYIKDSDIDYWIYGHSHYNVDVEIGNTKCVSNQLGYVFHGEHESFDPGKFIEA